MSFTLDANVLLYASDSSSPFHGVARQLLEQAARGPDIVYLFWPTAMAYLRLATHPAVFTEPLSPAAAMANLRSLLARPHVRSPGEREDFWRHFENVAADAVPSGNIVADAHIVTLMSENDVRTIWTHDRDFRRFRGIEVRDPFK